MIGLAEADFVASRMVVFAEVEDWAVRRDFVVEIDREGFEDMEAVLGCKFAENHAVCHIVVEVVNVEQMVIGSSHHVRHSADD